MGLQTLHPRTLQSSDTLGTPPPFGTFLTVHTGQSLGTGFGQSVVSTSAVGDNVALLDPSDVYDINNPNAAQLTTQPLVASWRPGSGGGYPTNLAGENFDVSCCNQMLVLSQYQNPRFASSNGCIEGSAFSGIAKGTNSYKSILYETQALMRVSKAPLVVLFSTLTHGETDAVNGMSVATYQADVASMQANLESDLKALTLQSASIPMLVSQQNSSTASLTGPNNTALAQLAAAQSAPSKIIFVGPKYQYPYVDGVHLLEYRGYGEKCAEIANAVLYGSGWSPFWPTQIVRTGTSVALQFQVPVPPLVIDGTKTAPHTSGGLSMWAPGKGLEAYDAPQVVTGATNASPIVLTVPDASGYSNGQSVLVTGITGNTAANGVWTITVSGNNITLGGSVGNGTFGAGPGGAAIVNLITITAMTLNGPTGIALTLGRTPTSGLRIAAAHNADAGYNVPTGGFGTGRCTVIRDSDPFVGRSGLANFNWCPEFEVAVA